MTYEDFKMNRMNNLNLLPEAYFVAVHDNDYVGMNIMHTKEGTDYLSNEFTGVKRPYRKKSIAKALKLRGINYAKANKYSKIITYNNPQNSPILSLNKLLGFNEEPALIILIKAY